MRHLAQLGKLMAQGADPGRSMKIQGRGLRGLRGLLEIVTFSGVSLHQ